MVDFVAGLSGTKHSSRGDWRLKVTGTFQEPGLDEQQGKRSFEQWH